MQEYASLKQLVRYVVDREVLLPLQRVARVKLLVFIKIQVLLVVPNVRIPAVNFDVERRLSLQGLGLVVLHFLGWDLALLGGAVLLTHVRVGVVLRVVRGIPPDGPQRLLTLAGLEGLEVDVEEILVELLRLYCAQFLHAAVWRERQPNLLRQPPLELLIDVGVMQAEALLVLLAGK